LMLQQQHADGICTDARAAF